ncbi:4-hydroxy-tetrahydrodipicolinate synthase [Loktanella fryxellensis]|uniref:4-hydroxy-tetrahydrodipicolinate synthase n=1 Tax=Loktanella fryxellensis TaxID=245187 RepID=A0A1H8HE11_9RHOB|nr:dihydrodipicolinate synthase family protein [Loktanella fryxellensis]SEN53768.1 4-hydroxy-tetrahydrodipicolinate synthase [Loktanella fryxellensis]
MDASVFHGTIPALLTPLTPDRQPDLDALVQTGQEMIAAGMSGVVYCGSCGDWPLLTDAQRMDGVARLTDAGVPVVVGTGAVNSATAVAHAAHAQSIGAAGLMVIPRVLSRGASAAAQAHHFAAILNAAPDVPAIIYNSPYYGYQTRADLFFALRDAHPNLIGFKEFGGASDLTYAAEHITCRDDDAILMVGVDTEVYHGFVNCGAVGAITGIGTIFPAETLLLVALSRRAAAGDAEADLRARELSQAFAVLAAFDEGVDLVLYFKHLMVLKGHEAYRRNVYETDALSASQAGFATAQFHKFNAWFADWSRHLATGRGTAA